MKAFLGKQVPVVDLDGGDLGKPELVPDNYVKRVRKILESNGFTRYRGMSGATQFEVRSASGSIQALWCEFWLKRISPDRALCCGISYRSQFIKNKKFRLKKVA